MLQVQAALEEGVRKHALVLPNPEPVVRLHEIGFAATKLICRAWTKSENYWKVYWDITRTASDVLSRAARRPPETGPPRSPAEVPPRARDVEQA